MGKSLPIDFAMSITGIAPGYFATYIASAPEKIDEAQEGLFVELNRIVEAGPTDKELDSARRHLIGQFTIEQQHRGAQAFHIALDSCYGIGPSEHLGTREAIAMVSREDVRQVAERIIDFDRYILASVRP